MSRKTQDQNVTKDISLTKCHTGNMSKGQNDTQTKFYTDEMSHRMMLPNEKSQDTYIYVCVYVTSRPHAFRFITD